MGPENDILGQFLVPETDRICQFMGPETDIMGERYYIQLGDDHRTWCFIPNIIKHIQNNFKMGSSTNNVMYTPGYATFAYICKKKANI